jgi:hypothetical protein
MFCANCACELPAVAKFCVRCGSTVDPSTSSTPTRVATPPVGNAVGTASVRCPKCGGQNPSDYSFCTLCGAALRPIGSPVFVSSTATAFNNAASTTKHGQTTTEAHQIAGSQRVLANDAADLNSKSLTYLDSDGVPSRLCAAGSILVVPRDSVLPPRCVKCANIPIEPWVRITFSWHHPGYYFLLISPVLYVIVALIVRKRIKLSIPLCKAHKSIRKKRLWMAAILLVGCIPLPAALGTYVGNEAAEIVAIWLGIGMFVGGLFFLAFAPPLKAIQISSVDAKFKGACDEFLTTLNSVSNQNSGRLQGKATVGSNL